MFENLKRWISRLSFSPTLWISGWRLWTALAGMVKSLVSLIPIRKKTLSRFRKYPGDNPISGYGDKTAFGRALILARELFDLDEYDPGIEVVSELVPGAIWRFDFAGEISIYRDGYPEGLRELCYWFHTGEVHLPGADNAIAAALLAVTDEAKFALRILNPIPGGRGMPVNTKIRKLIGLPHN